MKYKQMNLKIKVCLILFMFVFAICNVCSSDGLKVVAIGSNPKSDVTITSKEVEEILSIQYKKPKNVILMIGDGMGPNDIILAEKYNADCFDFGLVLSKIKNTGWTTTKSNNNDITDSAASGTALATGIKTNNGYIGISSTGQKLNNVSEIARENGKKVGIVTNDKLVGATPASFVVHTYSRENYAEIAKLYASFKPDVLIGRDYTYFSNLDLKGFALAKEFYQFDEVLAIESDYKKPFLGFIPEDAVSNKNTLAYCTEIALERLSKNATNGFFLMVENTACDNAGHSNSINGKLKGVVTFDRAIATVLKFMKNNPDTLLIITSDHETGGVVLPENGMTVDNSLFTTTQHTGINVRTFAIGYGAEYFNNKIVDNTDIAKFVINAVTNVSANGQGNLTSSNNKSESQNKASSPLNSNNDNETHAATDSSVNSKVYSSNQSESNSSKETVSKDVSSKYVEDLSSHTDVGLLTKNKKVYKLIILIVILLLSSFSFATINVLLFVKNKRKQK